MSLHPIAARWAAPGELFVRGTPAARRERGERWRHRLCNKHRSGSSYVMKLKGNGWSSPHLAR